MAVGSRPLKRAKRRVTAGLHDFLAGEAMEGPFRECVRAFLSRHGLPSPSAPAAQHLSVWRVASRVGDSVELGVVEEDVARSRSVYCDQCRVVGWSSHPVCGKRYHFIIRNDSGNPAFNSQHTCIRCGSLISSSCWRCSSCHYEMTSDDLEDQAYFQLENTTHLLHGVVHANGFGHLLRVNGREGGSKFLKGSDIMSFWDSLCKVLRVRKVTVIDVSKKHGLDYRLLHAVTAGRPWYGDWGYQFGAGSYALDANAYQRAVDTISNVPLSCLYSHTRSPRTQLQDIISFYQSLSDCDLVTVRDLFCCLTGLINDVQSDICGSHKNKKTTEAGGGVLSAWTRDDITHAEEAMIKVLQAVNGSKWVTWRALKGSTFRSLGSPELLDYCLKGLAGKFTEDGRFVAMQCNAEANTIEFRLESNSEHASSTQSSSKPSRDHLLCDLRYLYDALLNPVTSQAYKPPITKETVLGAAKKLLDCKQFIKHYDQEAENHIPSNPFAFQVWCHVELVDQQKDYTAPPPELLILPSAATVWDLKIQATRAFQETYLMFQRFQAENLLGHGYVRDMSVKDTIQVQALDRSKHVCLHKRTVLTRRGEDS
ncbi:PHD finger protein At1g33420-like [Dioscorea cayenensis subsp. rotundata]|uniref:PHD finger protein At1g33420-like n=1 Tax=Dioscorea cayennensis subsp. rotundata TaxID=55577 RepID=A0AB40B1V5_DIOCR|nr:PHD finger protein At1g33420-like [Dioscorea cayenensis subsp. rotundata]